MADTIGFIQILYKEEQRKELFPFSIPYFSNNLTPFFENSIIRYLVPDMERSKIAVCSWALRQKMTMRIPPRRELTEEVLQEDFDVMSFTKNSADHDMLGALEQWHPGSVDILRKIWAALGKTFFPKPKFPIYQNHFCARKEIYQYYVSDFLIPAMELMEENEEIHALCWQDSKYNRTTLNQPIDRDRINRLIGVPYYTMHAFLLERCFSMWINDKGYKIVYL